MRFDTFGGKGVAAHVNGEEVIIGNRVFFDERKIAVSG